LKSRQEYLVSNASKLSLRSRCALLSLSRSSLYYEPVIDKDTVLECLILDIWLERNNKGWRSIQADLREYHNLVINHKPIRRLMKKLGIYGILPHKNTSKAHKAHYKYPYGLKNLSISQANMAWCSDITYIKLPQGYVYLIAIVDIYSRSILDYEISNTLEAEFCIRCLERCIKKYGAPAIFNTDQGVQYTSEAWVKMLQNNSIMISMDGKGRWADNIWIERIWRTVKYECIYMYGIESLAELKLQLNVYIDYYNTKRLHSSLGYKTPQIHYQESIKLNVNKEFAIYCKYEPNNIFDNAA
jgi:putative transposase